MVIVSRRSPLQDFMSSIALLASLAFLCFATPSRGAEAALERLDIVTSTGQHVFQVEVARTMAERARGLMYRRTMPEDQGMLFDFHVEDTVTMWMKNTYMPLDMIFVSRDGSVVSITEDAAPMSERVISSAGPAYAVIELNAGAARRIGVVAGDSVLHPAFQR